MGRAGRRLERGAKLTRLPTPERAFPVVMGEGSKVLLEYADTVEGEDSNYRTSRKPDGRYYYLSSGRSSDRLDCSTRHYRSPQAGASLRQDGNTSQPIELILRARWVQHDRSVELPQARRSSLAHGGRDSSNLSPRWELKLSLRGAM